MLRCFFSLFWTKSKRAGSSHSHLICCDILILIFDSRHILIYFLFFSIVFGQEQKSGLESPTINFDFLFVFFICKGNTTRSTVIRNVGVTLKAPAFIAKKLIVKNT